MNIEELIMNGASEEEIAAALKAVYAEKEKQEKALRAEKDKEALKAEGRAYLINAFLAYSEAFDLLDGEEIDKEDINELEELIKTLEAVAPMYFKLYKDKLDIEGMLGDLLK